MNRETHPQLQWIGSYEVSGDARLVCRIAVSPAQRAVSGSADIRSKKQGWITKVIAPNTRQWQR